MYCRLNDCIALRSWKLVPRAYYVDGIREARGLSPEEFSVMLACDCEHDVEDSPTLRGLMARGLVEECEPGEAIGDWQRLRLFSNRYFPHINWSITGKCNFNCLHCFMAADNAPMMEEFTWEECLALLDEIEGCGIQTVTLTGGEPTLHPHFMDICREIARRHLTLSEINTNGSFITEAMLDEFHELGLSPEIKISYDGVGHHDWLRNRPGAEELARRAFELCHAKGFRTRAQTNVHRGNLDCMYDTVKWLDDLGVEEIRIIRTSEAPRWEENAHGMCLDIEEYYDAMLELMARVAASDMRIVVDVWQFAYFNPRGRWYGVHPVQGSCERYRDNVPVCKGARGTIAVSHTGELSPCNQLSGWFAAHDISLGNVKERPLHEFLSEGTYLECVTTPVSKVLERNERCAACPYWRLCLGGCRAIACALSGEFLAADKAKCLFFHDGYLEKVPQALNSAGGVPYRCINDCE